MNAPQRNAASPRKVRDLFTTTRVRRALARAAHRLLIAFVSIALGAPLAAFAAGTNANIAVANASANGAAPRAPAATNGESAFADRVRVLLDERLSPGAGQLEVIVGEPDPNLQLAPCARFEPFVPAGARLMGRTSIGVRCVEGANWSIYVPVQIRWMQDVWVVARPVPRGKPVAEDDLRIDRVDIAPFANAAVPAAEPPTGKLASRNLNPGEPLRRDLLRSPPVVQSGDQVKIVANGTGFAVTTSGKALTSGVDGQSVQVALEGGRVLTGVARPGAVVEVR